MKKKFLYNALIILALTACTEQDIIEQPSTPNGGTEVRLPADVNSGELLIKFKPEMTDILDRTMTRATGSGGAMYFPDRQQERRTYPHSRPASVVSGKIR